MKPNITIENINTQIKERWSKPEVKAIGVGEETLGAHSLIGNDGTFSS